MVDEIPVMEPKTPAAERVYSFDWSKDVAAAAVLSAPAIVVAPAGLVAGVPAVSGHLVSTLITGGEAGGHYTVTCTVTIDGSEKGEKSMLIPVSQHR